jgi:uncharacterized protein
MEKVIIKQLTEDEIMVRKIRTWPVWEKEISRFDWNYDSDEECLILEGEINIETENGNFKITVGDFVTFRKGLKCTWEIISPVKKHYNFP